MSSRNVQKSYNNRHMPFDPIRPYNTLPLLPPKAELETRAVLKACVEARAALAGLQQATALIPNPTVLINTIPLLEAQASSEIENIVTTTDALFRHAQLRDNEADGATKEAFRYRTALRKGFDSIKTRPLTTRSAEEICSIIKNTEMRVRRVPGTALANGQTKEIIYTPPVGESLLRDKLSNWESFMHNDTDLDPLVRMAVAHYQFEAIHPFTDGNGRTGRILNLLLLVQQGLLDQPILYLSRHIIRKKGDYYSLLQAVTKEQAWEPWVIYMLEGTADTARWTLDKITEIRSLIERTTEQIKQRLPSIYSRELVDAIFVQPYTRIENLVASGIAKRQTASIYLKTLAEKRILQEIKFGRQKLFLNSAFRALLSQDSGDRQRKSSRQGSSQTKR